MKKYAKYLLVFKLFILFIILVSIFLTSCFFKDSSTKECSSIVKIEGLFKVYSNGDFVIIVNPESKSRVSYYLKNLSFWDKIYLKKYNNKTVLAKVCIIKKKSMWNIEVKLMSISLLNK